MKSDLKKRFGFTFAEVLIVVSILMVVSTIVILNIDIKKQTAKASDVRRKRDIYQLQEAFEEYYNKSGCYPTYSQWQNASCSDDKNSFLSAYIKDFPCDPTTNTKYIYQTTDASGNACEGTCGQCAGYKLLATLADKTDDDIRKVGCDPEIGCGIVGPNGEVPNYGISSGGSVTAPGFVKNLPVETVPPGFIPPGLVRSTITPPPASCDLTDNLYPSTELAWYQQAGPYNTTDQQIYYDLRFIEHGLEWYKVENGQYPDCGCGWLDAGNCLKTKIGKYIPEYPQGTQYPYFYAGYEKNDNGYQKYCLTAKYTDQSYQAINFKCPVGFSDPTYKFYRANRDGVVAHIPYGNVWPVLPLETQNQRDTQRKRDLRLYAQGMENYKNAVGYYPQIIPRYDDSSVSFIYNMTNLKSQLYPTYMSEWPIDPSGDENLYSVFLYNKDTNGVFQNYCLISFMDQNSSCQNLCGIDDSRFYYNILSQSACYGIKNP